MALMFGYKWADGTWRSEREPRWHDAVSSRPEPKKQWVKRGFFKHSEPMSRREVALKAINARTWLEYTLREPMPARKVLKLAAQEGLTESGVRRAKKHHKVKSVRAGGKGTGRCNPWIWIPREPK